MLIYAPKYTNVHMHIHTYIVGLYAYITLKIRWHLYA